jgi:AraC-like DNA-binding protein
MNDVARALGIARRTLDRQLAAEGNGFRSLLDELRRDELAARLELPGASLTRVALELGFSDLSSLSRAQRRWFGATLARVRRKNAAR